MSEAPEESFISHLVELRDRLMRSLIAIAVVLGVLCIYPGPGEIYDILAAPLTKALPEGTKMVAIGVITPFMVPLKVTAMVAFVLSLPFILYQAWSFIASYSSSIGGMSSSSNLTRSGLVQKRVSTSITPMPRTSQITPA